MNSIKEHIRKYQLISFFLLNFLITWFFFLLPNILGTTDNNIKLLLSAIGGSGPAIAAIMLSAFLKPNKTDNKTTARCIVFLTAMVITLFLLFYYLGIPIAGTSFITIFLLLINAAIAAYIISGGLSCISGIRQLLKKLYYFSVSKKWYLIAFLVPLAIYIISGLSGVIGTGSPISVIYPHISYSSVLLLIVSFFYIGLVRGPLREEIGWRGFALPRLQWHFSPLISTLILSVIWTLWHLPLYINGMYPGGPGAILDRCYWNIGLTFLFTWIYNHTKGSLFICTLFHTTINTCGTLINYPENISVIFSLSFIAVVNIAAIAVIILDRMWVRLPEDSESVYQV